MNQCMAEQVCIFIYPEKGRFFYLRIIFYKLSLKSENEGLSYTLSRKLDNRNLPYEI